MRLHTTFQKHGLSAIVDVRSTRTAALQSSQPPDSISMSHTCTDDAVPDGEPVDIHASSLEDGDGSSHDDSPDKDGNP